MHYNYKLNEQVINNIIKRHIKLFKKQEQIQLIIYYTKFKTSNLIITPTSLKYTLTKLM